MNASMNEREHVSAVEAESDHEPLPLYAVMSEQGRLHRVLRTLSRRRGNWRRSASGSHHLRRAELRSDVDPPSPSFSSQVLQTDRTLPNCTTLPSLRLTANLNGGRTAETLSRKPRTVSTGSVSSTYSSDSSVADTAALCPRTARGDSEIMRNQQNGRKMASGRRLGLRLVPRCRKPGD